MTSRVRWTSRATEQLASAALFIDEARSGHGGIFLDEVQRFAQMIEKSPRIAQRARYASSIPT